MIPTTQSAALRAGSQHRSSCRRLRRTRGCGDIACAPFWSIMRIGSAAATPATDRGCTDGLREGTRVRAGAPMLIEASVSSKAVRGSSTGGRINARATVNIPTTPTVKRTGPIRSRAPTRMRRKYSSRAVSVNEKAPGSFLVLGWLRGTLGHG